MFDSYYPHLKTTISELRALRFLSGSVLDKLTPVLELTKSNRTKRDKQGDVNKRLVELQEIFGEKKFYLDPTTEDQLSNDHIDSLFDDEDGYRNWANFVDEVKKEYGLCFSPFLLLYEDSSHREILRQAENLLCIQGVDEVALRIEGHYVEYEGLLGELAKVIEGLGKSVTVFYDLKAIDERTIDAKSRMFFDRILPVVGDGGGRKVLLSSSFPASIYERFGSEPSGSFPLLEKLAFQRFREILPEMQYGDYSLIYPKRNEKKAYNWTPRIDFPTDDACYFYREKREEGGYAACASYLISNSVFSQNYLDCWGVREVVSAAQGIPNGKSPSYWISVRANTHLSRIASKIK